MLDACFNGTWSQHLTGILSNDVGVWTSELSVEHCNRDKKKAGIKLRQKKQNTNQIAYMCRRLLSG
jgi:hypothetical protein